MKRPRYTHRPRIHLITRNPMGGVPSDALLSQVREHAEMGERVRIYRPGFLSYDIARNGPAFIVLPVVGRPVPIATCPNVWAAIMAGDQHVEAVRRGEFDADDFGGDDSGSAAWAPH